MKVVGTDHIELSEANLRALWLKYQQNGTSAVIYKTNGTGTIAVSVVANEDHYTPEELEDRRNPYQPPEAWAGVL